MISKAGTRSADVARRHLLTAGLKRVPRLIPTVLSVAVIFLACTSVSQAGKVTFGAIPSEWQVTGAGASNATPFLTSGHLSITSNENETGTFVTGGNLGTFDGYWVATDSFFLPLDVTSISLSFAGFESDDRALLELNGTIIGDSGNGDPGSGSITLTDGGALLPYNFTNMVSGTITTGFNFGGTNSLTVIVNNTGTGIQGATRTFQGTADNTFFKVSGSVTYTESSPEPTSIELLLAAGFMTLWIVRMKRPKSLI